MGVMMEVCVCVCVCVWGGLVVCVSAKCQKLNLALMKAGHARLKDRRVKAHMGT